MKNCFLSLILLFALATLVFAQSDNNAAARLEALQKSREMQRSQINSPEIQQRMRDGMMWSMTSMYEGSNLSVMGMLQLDHFREALGVTEEQKQRIQNATFPPMDAWQNDPEFKPIMDEMIKLREGAPAGPLENASEETRRRFSEIQDKIQDLIFKRMTNKVNDNLTPDQRRKIQEYNISTMVYNPIVSPSMFEALDLSDEQKEHLNEIQKEMKPEFEKSIEKWVNVQVKWQEKFRKAREDELDEKLKGVTDPDEMERIMQEPGTTNHTRTPEELQELIEAVGSGRAFADKLKFRMFDVLTDEQMERMAQLIDNPPDYIKKMQGRDIHTGDSPPGEWKPGPDSWKPGDPIPEEYREERRARFPKRTQ